MRRVIIALHDDNRPLADDTAGDEAMKTCVRYRRLDGLWRQAERRANPCVSLSGASNPVLPTNQIGSNVLHMLGQRTIYTRSHGQTHIRNKSVDVPCVKKYGEQNREQQRGSSKYFTITYLALLQPIGW